MKDEQEPGTTGYPRKRRRTRRRLIEAGMVVLAARGPGNVTAGEIAASAGVAPGTFYNHFPSLDDFIDAVAADLGTGIEIGRDTLTEIEHDPAVRVAIGTMQLLQMADIDPVSASAFVTLTAVRPDFRARIRALVDQAIRDGIEAGAFDVEPGPAAVNAVLGAALQTMRSQVLGETGAGEAVAVARLVLRLLGVRKGQIERAVERAAATVAAQRPQPATG